MKAVLFEKFQQAPRLVTVDDPAPAPHGVVLKVAATGVCRSDWHGWMGHDSGIDLPHVPGHELAGVVEAAGKDVTRWKAGDKVTVPFFCGCGSCSECHAGHQQVCLHQEQPGFTHWGSFAEYVTIHQADLNLVALPESLAFATADLEAAAQLVLAPRATQLPQDTETQPPDPPDTAEPPPLDSPAQTEADILVEAVRAVLPEGLLPAAQGQSRTSANSGRGEGQKSVLPSPGRPLPPRRNRPDGRSRIDFVATLRSAAHWHHLRGAEPGSPAIRASDICLKRFETRSARLLIFVVDASGSAAHARLNEAKGAVELLLARAYARRDQVALIGFRNREAGLLLPPSRSLVQAKRRLAALPGGGATPLAHGLKSAGMLACQAQAQGQGLAPPWCC